MQQHVWSVVLVLISTPALASKQDYQEATFMDGGSEIYQYNNIPLQYGVFDETKDSVNHTDRVELLKAHNHARSIAQPTATNMRFMIWNNSLEKSAQDYARECIFAHSDSKTRPLVSENIYAGIVGYHHGHAVERWDYEKHDWDYENNKCKTTERPCGHYTQVVWHHSVELGCGIAYCKDGFKHWLDLPGWITICHYYPGGNWVGDKPYESGTPCSNCPPPPPNPWLTFYLDDFPKCEDNLCQRDPKCGDLKCKNGKAIDQETCLCDCGEDPENRLGGFCGSHPNPDRSLQPLSAACTRHVCPAVVMCMHLLVAVFTLPIEDMYIVPI